MGPRDASWERRIRKVKVVIKDRIRTTGVSSMRGVHGIREENSQINVTTPLPPDPDTGKQDWK